MSEHIQSRLPGQEVVVACSYEDLAKKADFTYDGMIIVCCDHGHPLVGVEKASLYQKGLLGGFNGVVVGSACSGLHLDEFEKAGIPAAADYVPTCQKLLSLLDERT